jgi:hypothetical protein
MLRKSKASEVWRDIPGYIGYYQASSLGRIRSVDRIIYTRNGQKRSHKGKVLSQGTSVKTRAGNYKMVVLNNGTTKVFHSHRIIAKTFLGNHPIGRSEVNHKNSKPGDNRPKNLEWCSKLENIAHQINNKVKRNSKIMTKQTAVLIKHALFCNYTTKSIAKKFNVSERSVRRIANFKTWKGLQYAD